MTSPAIPDRLEPLLGEVVGAHGMDLEAVELTPAGKRRVLRIAVDQDGGVTLDDVADVTRAISAELDDSDVMGNGAYTLEVTSRGTDRPLTLPRHWRRNADRLVAITLNDGTSLTGRIVASTEETVALTTETGDRSVDLSDVAKARVQVELNRKDR